MFILTAIIFTALCSFTLMYTIENEQYGYAILTAIIMFATLIGLNWLV